MIRVGVNGFGVIGRRVADAVAKQPDMKLVGIAKTRPDYKAQIAAQKGYTIFGSDDEAVKGFKTAGYSVGGTVKDLLAQVDVVVDACPEDVGKENKELYRKAGVKVIFQGGEDHEIAQVSFVAQCNYDLAKGKQFVRAVSCNTTGLSRTLHTLDQAFQIKRARVVIARRASDPDEPTKGPIDSVNLDPVTVPSHHGPDVQTVLPNIDIITMAYKIPTTHMHLHSLICTLKQNGVNEERVINALSEGPRILLVSQKQGIKATAHVMDYARELGRNRGDLYEPAIWKESIKVVDGELYFFMAVHQESIVVPENIDAIRAVLGATSKTESMAITDRSLAMLT
ncbi:MAG: type II glyceraldehyde-3-phosphate dehydrogenase [Thaumarchaeota archaeon]|nr:type II glyceraldehyde-3-phosphate dehydrogenase [Nitrososphaerota archaeon]